jgi:hypothetical protein
MTAATTAAANAGPARCIPSVGATRAETLAVRRRRPEEVVVVGGDELAELVDEEPETDAAGILVNFDGGPAVIASGYQLSTGGLHHTHIYVSPPDGSSHIAPAPLPAASARVEYVRLRWKE